MCYVGPAFSLCLIHCSLPPHTPLFAVAVKTVMDVALVGAWAVKSTPFPHASTSDSPLCFLWSYWKRQQGFAVPWLDPPHMFPAICPSHLTAGEAWTVTRISALCSTTPLSLLLPRAHEPLGGHLLWAHPLPFPGSHPLLTLCWSFSPFSLSSSCLAIFLSDYFLLRLSLLLLVPIIWFFSLTLVSIFKMIPYLNV